MVMGMVYALPGPDPHGQGREIKSWLKSKGLTKAVLKPSHVACRLQIQHFALGDSTRCTVVWDVSLMSGITLGDRCSQYRGSTVEFNTCRNCTNPQFVTSTNPKAPPPVHNNAPFKPRFGQHPAITPAPGQAAASRFRLP
ncbi:hypothetical protein BYT27DRAFT_7220480 [Phlegmacium glaucopus]|nr:hypothetical protein BYT27DRAFT_7220480 [Phlegmacium glaucopus]